MPAPDSQDKEGHSIMVDDINGMDQTLESSLLCTEVKFCLESLIKLDHHQRALSIMSGTDCPLLYYRVFIPYLCSHTVLS